MLHKLITTLRKRGAHGQVFPVQAAEAAQAAELIAGVAAQRDELLAELQNIANANPRTWHEETRDQFQQWAQNRARAAIAKATGRAA